MTGKPTPSRETKVGGTPLPEEEVRTDAPHWRRAHFIPIRKPELVKLLAEQPALDDQQRELFLRVCRVLEATLHWEFQREAEELKEAYAPLNPDADTRMLHEPDAREVRQLVARVFDDFDRLLERANYERLSKDQIQQVVGVASDWGLKLRVDFETFERLEVYVRGEVVGQRTRRRLRNLYRPERVDVDIYQRLLVILRMKPDPDEPATDRPRPVFVKLFKNIPRQDVDMLLPGAQIQLSLIDRGKIALPTLSGLIVAGIKIVKGLALALLFGGVMGVITFFAFVGGTIGYGMRSFFGYLRTRDKYQLSLTRNLYYQNLDNNAGVLHRLLDDAEEQEFREAAVAYFVLWQRGDGQGCSAEQLDQLAEQLLIERAGLDGVDFETHDALAKLLRLGIASESADGRYRVLPPEAAAEHLERGWESCFGDPH